MNRAMILSLLMVLVIYLPTPAQDLGGRSLSIDPGLFSANGGDGDSPWPYVQLQGRDHGKMTLHSVGASLGDAQLFSWSERDDRDYEIRLVRLHATDGTEVFNLTDNRVDDAHPEIVGGPRGVSVLWQQERRGRRVLLAQELGRDGRPISTPHHLAILDDSIVSITAIPQGVGTYLLGQARRDGTVIVIEVLSPGGLRVPFATVPAECDVRVYFKTGSQGEIYLRWTEVEPSAIPTERTGPARVRPLRVR